MKKIRLDLKKIENDRELHRKTRYKSGFYLVSLAGYTNAGKSSLLNLFSGEEVKVGGKLFSTLSTTTRRIPHRTKGNAVPILLTDTVGFIENLPSWIIDAFHSTLEEIEFADVVVLVVDGSEKKELVEKKLQVSLDELLEIGVTSSVVIAINKIDLIDDETVNDLVEYLSQKGLLNNRLCIPISVVEETNIEMLLEHIYKSLPNMVEMTLQLPMNKEAQAFVSQLYKKTRVIKATYEKTIMVEVACNVKIKDKIVAKCIVLQGSIIYK